MAETWTISVGGRLYGPYSLEQMQGFHAENRLADHSMVARDGEEHFRPACDDPNLAQLFQSDPTKLDEPAAPVQPHHFGARPEAPISGDQPAHFVIVAEMKSRSISGLEEEILNLGDAHRFGTQAWILCSRASINTIRNALVQKLGKLDTLFVVDAARDKAAWFNLGPESDIRIRGVWSRSVRHSSPEKRNFNEG